MKIYFSAYEDVLNAFDVLLTKCEEAIKASSQKFDFIRNSCAARACEPL